MLIVHNICESVWSTLGDCNMEAYMLICVCPVEAVEFDNNNGGIKAVFYNTYFNIIKQLQVLKITNLSK